LTCSIGYILHVFVYPPLSKICVDFIPGSRRAQYGKWRIFSKSFFVVGTREVLNKSRRARNTFNAKVLPRFKGSVFKVQRFKAKGQRPSISDFGLRIAELKGQKFKDKGLEAGFISFISSISLIGCLSRPAAGFIGSIGPICSIGSANKLIQPIKPIEPMQQKRLTNKLISH
jgi:hypothetical protein